MNQHKKLNIVLDTNILLVSIPEQSKYHIIYESLIQKKYNLFITNDILKEYEEILHRKYYPDIVEDIINAILYLSNVYLVNPYFNWNLISADPDDNKFVDCAVAGNVDYIITNDNHFNVLKEINFPKINVLNVEEFKTLFK
jgi:uncharacterized protein